MQFKSYYVVWKLDESEIPREDNEGLNRTMQYGNKFEAEKKEKYKKSLNRTMQYGNHGIEHNSCGLKVV